MSLSAVFNSARFALDTAAAQTALVSRNIAGADSPNFTRRSGEPGTYGLAGPGAWIRRAESPANFNRLTEAGAQSAGADALAAGVDRMRQIFGGDARENAPSTAITQLRAALRTSAVNPSDPVLAGRAVETARGLAGSISGAAQAVGALRSDIETDLAAEAGRLTGLLASFETVNTRIVSGSRVGADVTDLMDQRDGLIKTLSQSVGLRTMARADNDMVLQTDGGAMLFETRARSVEYRAADPVVPGQPGGRFLVDGVTVAGPGAVMPLTSGAVQGLVALRDGAALTMEAQLDEAARLLVTAFRETDQTGGGKPDKAGLFVIDGAASLPPGGVRVPGLALKLEIAASVDPAKGGNALLLRDGGMSGDADYRANATGSAGFNDRLNGLIAALDEEGATDVAVGLGARQSVSTFADRSFGWLEETRRDATGNAEFLAVVRQRSTDALAADTGVSLDAEMTRLLELERSYGASAKLIAVVDEMYATLLSAVR
jgi:flagellar hook-associated protein 1 FlgK